MHCDTRIHGPHNIKAADGVKDPINIMTVHSFWSTVKTSNYSSIVQGARAGHANGEGGTIRLLSDISGLSD